MISSTAFHFFKFQSIHKVKVMSQLFIMYSFVNLCYIFSSWSFEIRSPWTHLELRLGNFSTLIQIQGSEGVPYGFKKLLSKPHFIWSGRSVCPFHFIVVFFFFFNFVSTCTYRNVAAAPPSVCLNSSELKLKCFLHKCCRETGLKTNYFLFR